MFGTRIQLMLVLTIVIALWVYSISNTSADLVAERKVVGNELSITTLSFANINTANRNQLIQFFTTAGIVPGGFDARTVRIEKQGKMDVKYSLQVVEKNGDHNFCSKLKMKIVKRDLEEIYSGNLLDLAIQNTLTDDTFEEWIVLVEFDRRDENLKNKRCEFDLYMRTYRNNPNENLTGIYATRTLINTITSGTW